MNSPELVLIGGHKRISPTSILMLKADVNYTQIYLDDGSQILSSTTIGILEKRLQAFNFFRPHKSVVINLLFVTDFVNKTQTGDYSWISLKNDLKIPLSRRRTTQFMKIMYA